MPDAVSRADVVTLDRLAEYIEELRLDKLRVTPENDRLRIMHYIGERELYYIFNEGDSLYDGVVSIPVQNDMYEYDVWNDAAVKADYWNKGEESHVSISVEPGKSLLIICGGVPGGQVSAEVPGGGIEAGIHEDSLRPDSHLPVDPLVLSGEKTSLTSFSLSICKSIDYPNFSRRVAIDKLGSFSKTSKRFSGFIRYETTFKLHGFKQAALEITDAYEGVEVFVNGISAGIQIMPSFVFDLTGYCQPGENFLAIEVATTLERERSRTGRAAPTGITGEVNLYVSK